MADLNFDPVIGEEVSVLGRMEFFRIVSVQPSGRIAPPNLQNIAAGALGLGTVDLQVVGSDSILRGVPWAWLQFDDETRPVRRVIDWLKTNPDPSHPYPDYVVGYEVETGEDHEGDPAYFIRFIVDPDYFEGDGKDSDARIGDLSQFLQRVRTELLEVYPDRRPYVRVLEQRRLLDVAS